MRVKWFREKRNRLALKVDFIRKEIELKCKGYHPFN